MKMNNHKLMKEVKDNCCDNCLVACSFGPSEYVPQGKICIGIAEKSGIKEAEDVVRLCIYENKSSRLRVFLTVNEAEQIGLALVRAKLSYMQKKIGEQQKSSEKK